MEQLPLAQSDAVFSGACPMECQGTPRKPIEGTLSTPPSVSASPSPYPSPPQSSPAQIFCKGLDPPLLLRIIWVYQQDAVKVAITHVPNNGSYGPREQ